MCRNTTHTHFYLEILLTSFITSNSFFLVKSLEILFYCFLSSVFSDEKSMVITVVSIYVMCLFSLGAFKIFFIIFGFLYINYHVSGLDFFEFILFEVF